jgi:hypothetical protein
VRDLFTLFAKREWTASKWELQSQNGKTRNAAANRCWHTFVVLQIIGIFRTFGAGWRRKTWHIRYLEEVSQRIDFVRNSLPSSEQLILETGGKSEPSSPLNAPNPDGSTHRSATNDVAG